MSQENASAAKAGTHHHLSRHRPRSLRGRREYTERVANARVARRGLPEPKRPVRVRLIKAESISVSRVFVVRVSKSCTRGRVRGVKIPLRRRNSAAARRARERGKKLLSDTVCTSMKLNTRNTYTRRRSRRVCRSHRSLRGSPAGDRIVELRVADAFIVAWPRGARPEPRVERPSCALCRPGEPTVPQRADARVMTTERSPDAAFPRRRGRRAPSSGCRASSQTRSRRRRRRRSPSASRPSGPMSHPSMPVTSASARYSSTNVGITLLAFDPGAPVARLGLRLRRRGQWPTTRACPGLSACRGCRRTRRKSSRTCPPEARGGLVVVLALRLQHVDDLLELRSCPHPHVAVTASQNSLHGATRPVALATRGNRRSIEGW